MVCARRHASLMRWVVWERMYEKRESCSWERSGSNMYRLSSGVFHCSLVFRLGSQPLTRGCGYSGWRVDPVRRSNDVAPCLAEARRAELDGNYRMSRIGQFAFKYERSDLKYHGSQGVFPSSPCDQLPTLP